MPGYRNIFGTWDDFDNLEIQYNLENCGMSGFYIGKHWFCDDSERVNVYIG